MNVSRRYFLGASAAGTAGALAMPSASVSAAPFASALGRDATQYGVRPGSPDDQTKALQRAIDDAARAQVPLALPPGVYRTGMLRLQNGTQLVGVRGDLEKQIGDPKPALAALPEFPERAHQLRTGDAARPTPCRRPRRVQA